ncbi:transcription-repair coupling factor [uncultured Victivallis sp.]|uniref:transcription-repair coupling factor n=1 Tax=uncultured Victivallis sp. TaxID=354118 RepID=UPI0025F5F523|nr:transcription-repair coupling factor [uncultured Victivallis sp.]
MKNWQKILKNYLTGPLIGGLSRSGVDPGCAAFLLLRAVVTEKKPLVVVFPELNPAERTAAECEALALLAGIRVRVLSIPECGRGKLLFPGGEARRARALNAALSEPFDLYIGSVHALTAPAPKPAETSDATLVLRPGMELPPAELLEKLVKLDYDDEYEATVSGEFARRGGIIDLFSPAHDFPCRVEFFGDEIDSLRSYAPDTQRSTGPLEEYRVIGRAGITAGGAAEADFFDYLEGCDYRLLTVDPDASRERLEKYSSETAAARFDRICRRCEERGAAYAFYDAVEAAAHPEIPHADLEPSLPVPDSERSGLFAPEARGGAYEMARRLLEEYLRRAVAEGFEIVLVAPHRENLPALKAYCRRMGIDESNLTFDVARLGSGFALPAEKLLVITERELVTCGYRCDPHELELEEAMEEEAVAEAEPTDIPTPGTVPEFSLADLDYGDYAVHLDHGIGIFRGFKILTTRGISREVLVLEYRDGQLLYVPLLQAHKVSRYLGTPGKVNLHALGGSKWSRDKESARHGVRSYAADMLRLQAMRQAAPGIAFPKHTSECRAFVRAFPFSDTPDQRRSTGEIFSDMESSRPMDRLLCGDVGYGKTEIAMRAVFKAVEAGYQAAVLAPTTVLAQQHYNSFRERFAEYPFTIEMLSRFRTGAEQSDIMRRLHSGGIDILIGTHRLCNPELKFRNLGLVVIDEEQRFGVKHKERLRRFRAEVDVLTMSATPIPRTLYLAMAGARDLSTLMTAPKQRLPVKTVIAPEEDELIVQAIKAELARGGQVYFLHNRVRTITEKAEHLKSLIPEARFAVAHGQMHEHELEEVMTRFLQGEVDCLVCSTIIESGLDVPNANTILIERADRFGLAELYQLRGRVGRWKHQAYAYMLLPKSQLVSTDARKRLAAIRRCSNLGAGFQLALRDLEIRGSGNLLGSEQSGHLNTIGFDLYCQLLKQEVASLRGERHELLPEVELGIDFVSFTLNAPEGQLAAAFPPEYIGGDRLRLDAYRRLSAIEDEEQLEAYGEELRDRFGPLPESVKNLLEVIRLRILAARAGYEIFTVVDGKVTLKNPGGTIYRIAGRQPTISYLNPPKLRLKHLLDLLRRVDADAGDRI